MGNIMIKVAGIWELGWNTPIMEYDLWHFPMRDFKVDEWYMSPISGINKGKITEIATIRESIDLNPDFTPIFVDENGSEDLADFKHPENALYILGKAGGSPMIKTDMSVKIETKEGKGLLWPHQAICIVLHDRLKKWQQQ